MSLLKKIKDKTGTVHDIGDSRVDAYETELSGAEHNVPYSPAVLAKTNAIEEGVSEHVGNTANPHKVTKEQLGLSNVENKSSTQIRSEITKENVTNALGYTPIDESRIGAANGVASLDASGRIPASQIPGGFDNIEEYENLAGFPETGEEGKIYVAKDTNLTYRWTGTQYVEISPSLALGETATTAYRGDRGKTAYDHSQVSGDSTVHHVHENKELLDTYTQTEADLANAVAKVHEHGNKSVLDGITSDKVTSWDGKEDAFDVLPLSKGGTGAATKKAAEYNIMGLEEIETTISDNRKLALLNQTVSSSDGVFRWIKASYIWTYIKGKISSVLGLTESGYSGKSETAGIADKAVADNSGNNIEETYATKTELDTHTGNTTVHITADERKKWNAKQAAITAGDRITIDGSTISADSQVFYATYGTTKFSEVSEAINNGKNVCAVYDKNIAQIMFIDSSQIIFAKTNYNDNLIVLYRLSSSDTWETRNRTFNSRLTFDTTPTASSTNPVTSGGIKTALDGVQTNIDTVDAKGIVVKEIDGEQVICFE